MFLLKWAARLIAVFESRIQRRISLNALGRRMGHGRAYVSQLKSHLRGIRIGDALEALTSAGDEAPEDFFHQVFEQGRTEPPILLACNRRRDGLAPSPFLLAIAPRVLAIIDTGSSGALLWQSRLAKIRRIEKLRFRDRSQAQRRLESTIRRCVRLLERSAVQPKAALGDLSYALACLAAQHRAAGRLDDAVDALLLAYPLAQLAEDPLIEGLWYQKAVYLMVYLGRCDRAYEWVGEEATLFIAASAPPDQTRCLVDKGFVLSHQGLSAEACATLRWALRILPEEDREFRCAAHQILAGNLALLGDPGQAIAELELAAKLATDSSFLLAGIHWSRARQLRIQRKVVDSASAFRTALQLQQLAGSPADVAELAFDFAGLLAQIEKWPELEELAAGMAHYVSAADCGVDIQETIEDFVALVRMRELTEGSLQGLSRNLPENRETKKDHELLQEAQPPGGISQPISGSGSVRELLFGGKVPLSGSSTAA